MSFVKVEERLRPWRWAAWLALALAALSGYWLASQALEGPGFPLDDAWIHQVYARNLGTHGEWAFLPGKPSAGSTAPLWTFVLAIGYAARLPVFVWAAVVGVACLAALAGLGAGLSRAWGEPRGMRGGWVAGIALALQWRLVWASASGMETALAALASLAVLWLAARERWGWAGLLTGAAVWVRPDQLTLLGPVALAACLGAPSWRARLGLLARVAAGFAGPFGLYLVFNLAVQGTIWPNTLYAKQAEYAILRETPLWTRYARLMGMAILGGEVLLLPGVVYQVYDSLRRREWLRLGAAVWVFGFIGLYAWSLPVTYQYARYLIPVQPVFVLLGLAGSFKLAEKLNGRWGRILGAVWGLSTALVWIGFYFIGAGRYARDVAIIQTEMVQPALWIHTNTGATDLIAAHDIGALGYYGERDILDLAGLISPEAIPVIRNEAELERLMEQHGAAYLMTFPDWYPELTAPLTPTYVTGGEYAPADGGENMAIYPLK